MISATKQGLARLLRLSRTHNTTQILFSRTRRVQRADLPTDPVVHAFHGPHGRGGVSCPIAGRGRWPQVGHVPRGNHNRLGRRYDGQSISISQPKRTRMRVRENLCPEDINMGMHVFFFCCSSTNYASSRKKNKTHQHKTPTRLTTAGQVIGVFL